jgi:tetratricopeptide (TPR) repeat protein
MDPAEYDLFISYSRADNAGGWVSGLRDAIYEDFKAFSSEPFRIFFDTSEIHGRQDWQKRLLDGLTTSRVLLVCLSPNYLRSPYCRWEWEEFARVQARRVGGGDPITGVYFVDLGGQQYDAAIEAWRHEVERVQFETLQPWFPAGVAALQQAEVRDRITALGTEVHEQLRQAQLANAAPGNLRRHNPLFVGRVEELRALRHALTGSAVGVVTAVYGVPGVGKSELAVTYAHAYAHAYQGGTWQVDADGQTEVLEAVSALAFSPELGIAVSDEQLKDRTWLGRRVLARLKELTDTATATARESVSDATAAGCLLLLDNVSEPQLLAAEQLAMLPDRAWFHLVVTTRLGISDVGAAGSRATVAMIEVGRLAAGDALKLIREHQPARDAARLQPDFSTAAQESAAEQIVDLLDGYTLAIEQAAVYLGTSGKEPTELLEVLRTHGAAVLDEVGGSSEGAQAILHKEKLTAAIFDQTVARLPARGCAALALASLLPPDTIPWDWLQQLTAETARPPHAGLPGLSDGDDWASTQRVLEGRRLLTQADDPPLARLHRVLGAHMRSRLVDSDTEQRLDTFLQQVAGELHNAATPDTTVLARTATAIAGRLADHRHQLPDENLAAAGLQLIGPVQERLDLATAHALATATLNTYESLTEADPRWQSILATSLQTTGDVLAKCGDTDGALGHHTRALRILEGFAESEPRNVAWSRAVASCADRVGVVLAQRRDFVGALGHCVRAAQIFQSLAESDPQNTELQHDVAVGLSHMGGVLAKRGDADSALQLYLRSAQIGEQITESNRHNTDWRRSLAVDLSHVGEVLWWRHDSASALGYYFRALQIRRELAESDPSNTEKQRDLALELMSVGDVLAGDGDTAVALQHFNHSLQITDSLTRSDPSNSEWQRDLALNLNRVGAVLAGRGDTDGAMRCYDRSLQICQRLLEADPNSSRHQRDLGATLDRMGTVLAQRGDTVGAMQHCIRSLEIAQRLAEAEHDNIGRQVDLVFKFDNLASLFESVGDPSATECWRKAYDILAALSAAGKLDPGLAGFCQRVAGKLGLR